MKPEEMREFAVKHVPLLYFDKREPFPVVGIGYTVFEESGKSHSSPKSIELGKRGRNLCIEYAVFFDYDIQHLYDLEHIWVYLDSDGKAVDCEASFHGMYMNVWNTGIDLFRGTDAVHLYSQPGKHAMMPHPNLFGLHWEEAECCMETAGKDGILNPGILEGYPVFDEADCENAKRYIKENYGFRPANHYVMMKNREEILIPWEKLEEWIPGRIAAELEKIRCWAKMNETE
ncbi:MAG: hypothetical protein Q4C77_05030 [Eubacteriales bacterium]|nr:hypothetical protein [Eubacteriales bacterium]